MSRNRPGHRRRDIVRKGAADEMDRLVEDVPPKLDDTLLHLRPRCT